MISRTQIHSDSSKDHKISKLATTVFFALGLLIPFVLAGSTQAYEWDRKSLEEAGNTSTSKQRTSALFSPIQEKGYVLGLKLDFEINTIFSTPTKKLKSEQLINSFIGEDYFSSGDHPPNELPLAPEMSIGAKPAKLVEIRF